MSVSQGASINGTAIGDYVVSNANWTRAVEINKNIFYDIRGLSIFWQQNTGFTEYLLGDNILIKVSNLLILGNTSDGAGFVIGEASGIQKIDNLFQKIEGIHYLNVSYICHEIHCSVARANDLIQVSSFSLPKSTAAGSPSDVLTPQSTAKPSMVLIRETRSPVYDGELLSIDVTANFSNVFDKDSTMYSVVAYQSDLSKTGGIKILLPTTLLPPDPPGSQSRKPSCLTSGQKLNCSFEIDLANPEVQYVAIKIGVPTK